MNTEHIKLKNNQLLGLLNAKRKRATITEEQSAFKAYSNAYATSNITLEGFNGLTYFPYQFER